jgi:cell division protease FtsH
MVGELGEVAYDRQHSQFLQGAQPTGWLERSYSEETAREIDCAVRETVARAMKRATSTLEGNRGLLEQGAKALLAKETCR